MKKIIYYCDVCGKEITEDGQEIETYLMPRRIDVLARDKHGAVLARVGGRVVMKPTHMHGSCACKVADMFNVIEDEGMDCGGGEI